MRCKICNAIDAEHHDKRDDTYLCDLCKHDIDELIYEWLLEDESEDTPEMPELPTQ